MTGGAVPSSSSSSAESAPASSSSQQQAAAAPPPPPAVSTSQSAPPTSQNATPQASPAPRDSSPPLEALRVRFETAMRQADNKGWKDVLEVLKGGKEIFAKRLSDIEPFLIQLDPAQYGPLIISAISACFNAHSTKGHDDSIYRSVDMLKHFIENTNLQRDHILHIYDQFVVLLKKMTAFLLKKGDQAAHRGVPLLVSAVNLVVDKKAQSVTALHGMLFALCLKTHAIEVAYQFVHPYVCSLFSPSAASSAPSSANSSSSQVPSLAAAAAASAEREEHRTSLNIEGAKQLLLYLYYGALVVSQKSEWRRAASLLEAAIALPGSSASAIQIEALKKLYILSLMINGRLNIPNRSAALNRQWKTAGSVYSQLASAVEKEPESGNRAAAAERLLNSQHRHFENDKNVGLVRLLIRELRDLAILRVAKLHSVVSMDRLHTLTGIPGDQCIKIMDGLVATGRLSATREGGYVQLAIPLTPATQHSIDSKKQRLASLAADVARLDVSAQLTHFYVARHSVASSASSARPGLLTFLEDEGLSMSNSPETHSAAGTAATSGAPPPGGAAVGAPF